MNLPLSRRRFGRYSCCQTSPLWVAIPPGWYGEDVEAFYRGRDYYEVKTAYGGPTSRGKEVWSWGVGLDG